MTNPAEHVEGVDFEWVECQQCCGKPGFDCPYCTDGMVKRYHMDDSDSDDDIDSEATLEPVDHSPLCSAVVLDDSEDVIPW